MFLDAKVKQLSEENKSLENEVKKLRQHLDEEREKKAIAEKFNSPPKNPNKESTSNGPIDSAAMETNSKETNGNCGILFFCVLF